MNTILTAYRCRLAGILLALLAASALVAEGPAETVPAETPPEAIGLRAYVDSETGELTETPSPEQVEVLSKRVESPLSRSTEGLKPFELPRGGRGVYLARRFQSALVIRLDGNGPFNADGPQELVLSCVDDPEHAPPPVQEEWPEK